MNRSPLLRAICFVLVAVPGITAGAELRATIQALASRHDVTLVRGDRLGTESVDHVSGDLHHQLRVLMTNYSYVIVNDDAGNVAKILVLGPKGAAPIVSSNATSTGEPIVIPTVRSNGHHVVEAALIGRDGYEVAVSMMVDTGASSLVLPESLIESLGLDPDELDESLSQTANGPVAARSAQLARVQIGDAVQLDVDAAFIPDDKLGGNLLLGMSFLGRYRMTIDDENDQLTLSGN